MTSRTETGDWHQPVTRGPKAFNAGTKATLSWWLRRGPCLAIAVLGLVLVHTGPAASQPAAPQPAANPLPTVIYPFSASDAAPPGFEPPVDAPSPARTAAADGPDQYDFLDGVPGYWGQYRRFHPVRARAMAERRSRVTVTYGETRTYGETGASRAASPRMATRPLPVPRSTIFLPNSAPRAIVVRSPMSQVRSLTR